MTSNRFWVRFGSVAYIWIGIWVWMIGWRCLGDFWWWWVDESNKMVFKCFVWWMCCEIVVGQIVGWLLDFDAFTSRFINYMSKICNINCETNWTLPCHSNFASILRHYNRKRQDSICADFEMHKWAHRHLIYARIIPKKKLSHTLTQDWGLHAISH